MTTHAQSTEPPLLRFIRALSADEREAFAETVGTTVGYINQLVGHPAPNPSLKLALAIEAESHRLSRQITGLTPLSLPDLLVGRIKTKRIKDHTTGEVFALLPNGELVRRRLDKLGRVVLIDAKGRVIDVEESRPGATTAGDVVPLEDDDAAA